MNTSTTMRSLPRLLGIPPIPLLDPKRKIMLLWSAKAGCTFGVKWFFWHMNLLDAALFYRGWVHDFREQIYYNSAGYKKAVNSFIDDYTTIKLVRNPYERAVSSYIHAIKTGYADVSINNFLGKGRTSKTGFSFYDFVTFITKIDISRCDTHHVTQVHPMEREGHISVTYLVQLKEATRIFAKIEKDLGLPESPIHEFVSSVHHSRRTHSTGSHSNTVFDASTQRFPPSSTFYTKEIADIVYRIYSEDFYRYGYSADSWM